MTREQLFNRWVDDCGLDYIFTGSPFDDRQQFFEDLEAWYESRHVKELNTIKNELLKSIKEMDNAFKAASGKQIGGCTSIDFKQDCMSSEQNCMSSELCPYCTNPPRRFQKG